MQKVVGSSPIIRSIRRPRKRGLFRFCGGDGDRRYTGLFGRFWQVELRGGYESNPLLEEARQLLVDPFVDASHQVEERLQQLHDLVLVVPAELADRTPAHLQPVQLMDEVFDQLVELLEGLYAGLLRLARLDEDELARLLSSS